MARWLPALTLLFVIATLLWWLWPVSDDGTTLHFVGRASCAECHPQQAAAFRGSHHDLAMDEARMDTVLGNFGGATLQNFDVTTTFGRRSVSYAIYTDGPDGQMHDYAVPYVFGHYPLQQYLLPIGKGRLQALGTAWDSRPLAQGGQRWFHLYAGERIPAGDELHWTGLQQNWNYMCAECHSTGLKRNYDAVADRYDTKWNEIDVSCEACHGEASRHLVWARLAKKDVRIAAERDRGLTVNFDARQGVTWSTDPATGLPRRSRAPAPPKEIETCARCHGRRSQFAEDWTPGKPLLDTHQPALLTTGLYWPDGQMRDEVYNWGSFLQSRMHAAGVTCSDCHDPHTGKPRQAGDSVCLQCHEPRFGQKAHHFHKEGTAAAACVACHAPTVTYMGVDPRHDHSFRIPRPDLSVQFGVPDACTGCHKEQKPAWAVEQLQKWYGRVRTDRATWTPAFAMSDQHPEAAEAPLLAVAANATDPAIVRASALHRLPHPLSPAAIASTSAAITDRDPLLRWTAADTLADAPLAARRALQPLLRDPVRGVRIAAANALVDVPGLDATNTASLAAAVAEYEAAQHTNADRPEAHLNLGNLRSRQHRPADAETEYRAALRLDPKFLPAFVNLADLCRELGKETESESWLRQGLKVQPNDASLSHSLGLCLVRQKQPEAAIEWLRLACERAPESERYAYVYAVALRETGKAAIAVPVLEAAVIRHPDARELLAELIASLLTNGAEGQAKARARAAEYVGKWPDDATAAQLRAELLR